MPLIVPQAHGSPAIPGALGMLSGFCGTLMTPTATVRVRIALRMRTPLIRF